MGEHLIFQLGTNNWQRDGEFAPGSGILHEAHHRALNDLPGVHAYSMYPSRRQRFRDEDVHVFEIEHDIPIAESVSPVSSYRWHAMSETEVADYRARLVAEVHEWTCRIEDERGTWFTLFVAHHAFMNTVALRDVNRLRVAQGRPRVPVLCFVHGTELKMFDNELRGDDPAAYPLRFGPFMAAEKIFDLDDPDHGVDVVAAISRQQVEAFARLFPQFPSDRVLLSVNGYNQRAFRVLPEVVAARGSVLAGFSTAPYEGSPEEPVPVRVPDGIERVVAYCGKFADWKRLEALLEAAADYESDTGAVTLVVGTGPPEAQVERQELARGLGLQRTFFLGPRGQEELATLFNTADVAVFPSRNEPFGLVFVEAMACGTPVIGADSGGPRDFVTDEVGHLVGETDDRSVLAAELAATVRRAFAEDWKATKGPAAARFAEQNFSVVRQVETLLRETTRVLDG